MTEALENLRAARAEVRGASPAALEAAPDVADALRPGDVPSVARLGAGDRLLAEIDQDGFAFAVEPEDAGLFPGRPTRLARKGNLIDVVLAGGRVCVRKRFRPPPLRALLPGPAHVAPRDFLMRRLWHLAGVHFHAEVAALLRLRELPFVPRLRRLDEARATLWMDCLAADSLRHRAAGAGEPVHDADLSPALAGASEDELGRREARLLDAAAGTGWRAAVAAMVRDLNRRGVVPRDIKLGNLMAGRRTGRLYWIDFENSRLASQPGFEAARAAQDEVLRARWGVVPDEGDAAAAP